MGHAQPAENWAEAIAACPDHLIWVRWAWPSLGSILYARWRPEASPPACINILARAVSRHYHRPLSRRLAQARLLIRWMRDFEDVRAEEMNGTNVTAGKKRPNHDGKRLWGRRGSFCVAAHVNTAQKLKTFFGS